MNNWLDTMFSGNTASGVMWIALALVVLLLLWIALRFFKTMRSGTFIAGGRNRAPRLAVVDAAAVDTQRRLVLVRRDNVEHLILIGGPTDIVVEQGILTDEHERALSTRQLKVDPTPQAPKREPAPQVPSIHPVAPAPMPGGDPQFNEPLVSAPRRHTVAVTPPEAAKPKGAAPIQPILPRANAEFSPTIKSGPKPTKVHVPRVEPVQPASTPLEETLEQEMDRLLDDLSIEETQKR